MDMDDEPGKVARAITVGEELDDFSIEELSERLTQLRTEIIRVEAEIVNKKSKLSDADSIFNI